MGGHVTVKRRVQGCREDARGRTANPELLLDDLAEYGPVQPGRKSSSALSATEYHCHLSCHWVACWRHEDQR